MAPGLHEEFKVSIIEQAADSDQVLAELRSSRDRNIEVVSATTGIGRSAMDDNSFFSTGYATDGILCRYTQSRRPGGQGSRYRIRLCGLGFARLFYLLRFWFFFFSSLFFFKFSLLGFLPSLFGH